MGSNFIMLWAFIFATAIFVYVIIDGFNLGVGILSSFAKNKTTRDLVMHAISPIGHGNSVLLVLVYVGLFALFPLAFKIISAAIYIPIFIMLIGLFLRGVAYKFYFRDKTHHNFWDRAFNIASLITAFMQGIILGVFIQGFEIKGYSFSGNSYDCFTPFSILVGFTVICGYGYSVRIG